MSREELIRFNYLSERVMDELASASEIKEYNEFQVNCNRSIEHSIIMQAKNNQKPH